MPTQKPKKRHFITKAELPTAGKDMTRWINDAGKAYATYSASEDPLVLIRKNIKLWIAIRGYATYEKFAYELGIPKSTLSQVLNNKRSPRVDTLQTLASALEISVITLLQEPDHLPANWDDL